MIKYYIIRHHFCQVRIRAADKSPNMGIDPLTAAAHILIEQSALWKSGKTDAPSVHCPSPSRCFQILRCRRKTVLSYIKFLWLEIAVIFPLERTFVMRLGQKREWKLHPPSYRMMGVAVIFIATDFLIISFSQDSRPRSQIHRDCVFRAGWHGRCWTSDRRSHTRLHPAMQQLQHRPR